MRPDLEARIKDLENTARKCDDFNKYWGDIIDPLCLTCLDVKHVLIDGHDSHGHFITKKVECPTCKDLL
jgi:hypothetical protein